MTRTLRGIPEELDDALRRYVSGVLTTFSRSGVPLTVAMGPRWQPEHGRFLLTCTIGRPQKIYNIERNPRVSLLFSNPTGTGKHRLPQVLVQGQATVSKMVTWDDELAEFWAGIWSAQPEGRSIGSDDFTRSEMDWYFMRVKIHLVPHRIRWWPGCDLSGAPQEVDLR